MTTTTGAAVADWIVGARADLTQAEIYYENFVVVPTHNVINTILNYLRYIFGVKSSLITKSDLEHSGGICYKRKENRQYDETSEPKDQSKGSPTMDPLMPDPTADARG
ncbi:hypothetical protein B9Z55_000855 [Caenorhabditis nigoni]|uniref:Uncharacterized protein n=1 Tax=Caenorhabditis nigoni TaxID=1611254 RepID=A0A2G5VVJ2_9PELO|nr:hypothetical protein B9Z55_000855 [Caenorhabditis nigoni]